jgi:hypothetical protein
VGSLHTSYLPSFPYQDNPVFHTYAGLISLYLAQPTADSADFNTALLRDAQSHIRNAHTLDPENIVAQAFLQKVFPVIHADYFSFIVLNADTRLCQS